MRAMLRFRSDGLDLIGVVQFYDSYVTLTTDQAVVYCIPWSAILWIQEL
jgi:hypothetical protein